MNNSIYYFMIKTRSIAAYNYVNKQKEGLLIGFNILNLYQICDAITWELKSKRGRPGWP